MVSLFFRTMRITIFGLFIFLFSSVFSQTCTYFDDYNSSAGWLIEDTDASGIPVTIPRISISGGTLNFINSNDGFNVTRLYKPLGFTLCDNWVTEFKFTPTAINTSHPRSAGHHLFSVSAGPLAPLYSAPPLTFTNQDALGVTFVSLNSTFDLNIIPLVKNGTNRLIISSCEIPLDGPASLGQTYLIRMERINPTQCRITVFRNATMQLVGTCCFNIPSSIQNLNYLQHANFTGGDLSRTLTGTIDSLCIKNCFSQESLLLGNDTTVCANSYSLNAQVAGASYLWSTGNTSASLTVNATGTYWVEATLGGCTYRDTITITLGVDVNIGRDTTLCEGNSLLLKPNKSGTNYLWNDGSSDSTLLVTTSGVYWVQVVNNGCQGTDSITVTVINCQDSIISPIIPVKIEMPNVFSPNGDGVNDFFNPIVFIGVHQANIKIYNRWGQIVHESFITPSKGWDGTNNGEKCADGVYFWVVQYIDPNSKKEVFQKGFLTVFH